MKLCGRGDADEIKLAVNAFGVRCRRRRQNKVPPDRVLFWIWLLALIGLIAQLG